MGLQWRRSWKFFLAKYRVFQKRFLTISQHAFRFSKFSSGPWSLALSRCFSVVWSPAASHWCWWSWRGTSQQGQRWGQLSQDTRPPKLFTHLHQESRRVNMLSPWSSCKLITTLWRSSSSPLTRTVILPSLATLPCLPRPTLFESDWTFYCLAWFVNWWTIFAIQSLKSISTFW